MLYFKLCVAVVVNLHTFLQAISMKKGTSFENRVLEYDKCSVDFTQPLFNIYLCYTYLVFPPFFIFWEFQILKSLLKAFSGNIIVILKLIP